MKAVVPEYHTRMMHCLRTSPEYETFFPQYVASLLGKIRAIENLRNTMIQEIDDQYIELLERSLMSSVPLVDISIDSRFKQMRRDMYQQFESAIATVEFEMHQAMRIVDVRRIRLLVFGSSEEKQE